MTPSPFAAELRALLRLALPIVLVQLGVRAMNTVDTMMVGHYDAAAMAAMAAMAVGNACVWLPTIFCIGLLMAADPLISQAVGARDRTAVALTLQRALVWTAVLALPTTLLLQNITPVLALMGIAPGPRTQAATYTAIVAWGTLPVLVFHVLRTLLQAHHTLRPLVLVILAANAVNALLNWILVYGHLGLPELGMRGSAIATTISRWLLALGLLTASWPLVGPHLKTFRDATLRRRALRLPALLRMGSLGLPIGLQISLELGIFALTTLLAGRMGQVAVGGHQVALDLAATSFMVPMGLGVAAAVRTGHAVGRGDMPGARSASRAALLTATAVMLVAMAVFFAVPHLLAKLYLRDDAAVVVAMAASLIPIAGFFQVFDGIQTVAVGLLRGLGDTRTPLLVNLVGFYVLGLPLGSVLGFGLGLGPAGLWWGLATGLAAVAAGLLLLVRRRLGEERRRLAVD